MFRKQRRTSKRPRCCWVIAILAILLPAVCKAQATVAGRPILFVHGWCGTATDWGSLRDNVITYAIAKEPTLYTDSTRYTIYFDGQTTRLWPSGNDLLSSTVGPSARFFSIDFYDPSSAGSLTGFSTLDIDTMRVAAVSILNKADELAHVIRAITTLTRVREVIVIAHSMGGLVARAYLQDQAVHSPLCSDEDGYAACAGVPKTTYAHDIAKLITLDTPHSGAVLANYVNTLPNTSLFSVLRCFKWVAGSDRVCLR